MENLCLTDFELRGINAYRQLWRDGDRYLGYSNTPRGEHGLILITGCTARFVRADGTAAEAKEGDMLYLPKGERYTAAFSDCRTDRTRCLLVNFQLCDECGAELRLGELDILSFLTPYEERTAMQEIVDAYCAPLYYPGEVKGGLCCLLTRISRKMRLRREIPARFAPAEACRCYIEQHLSEDIPVKALARRFCLSESGLRKLFHAYLGVSPLRYRQDLRIDRARRLLGSEAASVAEVARAVGMEDVNYFSRLFRQRTGMTPSACMRSDLC